MKEKIYFDRDWSMQEMRNLIEKNCYPELYKHEDLRVLCICEEDYIPAKRDWREATFVVPTEWLRQFCEKEFGITGITGFDYFMNYEYVSDDSEIIFANALMERKVIMIDFVKLVNPIPKTYEIRKADMKNLQSYSIWKHANEDVWEKCDEKFFTGIDTLILVETRKVLEFDYDGEHFCIFDESSSRNTITKKERFRDLGICNVVYLRFSREDFVDVPIKSS